MRVLMISWEYPPLIVGGIATHVEGLATAMARGGNDVVVLSLHHADTPDDQTVDGVRVLRAKIDLPWLPDDYLAGRMASANHQLTQLIVQLGSWRPDIVHAHDWMVAWAADTIKVLWNIPLIATIHATERGRHGGHVPQGTPAAINSIEWWLTYQASSVIACSRFMVREVINGFELANDKVHLVPNGVDVSAWTASAANDQRQPLVVAWGRIQYEKGFQVLARAMAVVRQALPDVRCVIAGRGSYLPELQTQIDIEGVSDIVNLAGFVSDDQLHALVAEAGCVVIPSLYEPFGIVALEGMAAGAATIVARTGGLAEIVEGTDAGLLFEPGNHDELAERICQVLTQPLVAAHMRSSAATILRQKYSWDALATATIQVYQEAIERPR